ncbi:hypothetical protein [Salibacter sp.]|uniref:hypothetical protein n=1 Tax=Salibacter sp. TaxID=2010995 RepID=UPI00286FF606|nr:hypothetical protein [Salibacter sp.]
MINFLLTLIVVISFNSNAIGQNLNEYSGLYRLGGVDYEVKFDYYFSEGDTVLDGNFDAFHQVESGRAEYDYTSLNGKFTANKLDSKWLIKTGIFEPEGNGVYNDYTFSFNVNGNEFKAEVFFDEGKETGNWKFYDCEIRNSKISDTTLKGNVSYVNNSINKFSFYNSSNSLVGELDSGSLAKGKWQFELFSDGEKTLKNWVFKNGHLAKVEISKEGQVLTIPLLDSAGFNGFEETKELDRAYLEILKLKIAIQKPDVFEKYNQLVGHNELYFQFLDQYNKIDDLIFPLRDNTIFPEIKVNISRLPYLDKEEVSLKTIIKNHEKSGEIINSVLDDPQVNIASISDEEIARYRAVLKSIRKGFYSSQKSFIELYQNNYLPYFDRNEVVDFKFDLQKVIEIKSDSISKDYLLKANYDHLEKADLSQLKKLELYSENILKDLELINSNVDAFVSKYKRKKKLVDIESELIEKYDSVKYLNDSLITAEHNSFAEMNVNKAIAHFADSSLKVYSALTDENEKMKRAQMLLNCYQKTEDLIYTVHQSTDNIYKINDAYTREVFNPYTYTNMEEKAKPSIYNSFSNLLLPGIFHNLNRLNCHNINQYRNNFSVLFNGMMNFLKEENTNRVERKVKRADNPREAAEILNLELKFQ